MARAKSPNREKAFEIFREHNGNISSKEIADLLGEKVNNINSWRVKDKWNNNKGGAPKGNKNAVGNSGGAAPEKNQNARTYGWYSKYYPTTSRNLIKEAEEAGGTLLDILWAQIMTQWIAIIRAQKIMHVTSKKEMIKELKKSREKKKSTQTDKKKTNEDECEYEYEFQFAWDRQATFLNSQSRAMAELRNLIKQYDEMLHNNWETATEEQKLRVEKLRVQVENEKKGIGSNSLVIFKGEDSLED